MKNIPFERCDLKNVYCMGKYNQAVSYGNQHIDIPGVQEHLQDLEIAKERYVDTVASIVESERENEESKYQQFQKWVNTENKYKHLEIILICLAILNSFVRGSLPTGLVISRIYSLLDQLLCLVAFVIGPCAFFFSKHSRRTYGMQYKQYADSILSKLHHLGNDFTKLAADCYEEIDNLYLQSLEPMQRELILLRRQQEQHSRDLLRFEQERRAAEEERLREQQKTRQATEELLAIEKEREKRYREY